MNQNPRSAQPYTSPPPQRDAGYVHGLQSAERWDTGQSDSRQIVDQLRSASLWRLRVVGANVELNVEFGTTRIIELRGLRVPCLLYTPGQLVVYAKPIPNHDGEFIGGEVQCAVTPVTGARDAEARYIVTAPNVFDPIAARFRALQNSVVTFPDGTTCALTPTQFIPLIAGAVLTAGVGFAEFEA